MDTLIIYGAKYLIYIIVFVAVGAVLVSPHRQRLALLGVVALVVGYALARIVGIFYSHPQPFVVDGVTPLIPHAVDNAFPSDHALVAGVCATVAWLADYRVGAVLWVGAVLVGGARVLAGLHYTVDIVTSIVLSLVCVWVVREGLKWLRWY